MNDQSIITLEPGKRGGRPCIRRLRIAVAAVLGWLAAGMTPQAIANAEGRQPHGWTESWGAKTASFLAGP